MDVVIRACELADAEAVERLRIAGWQAAYRGIIPDAYLDGLTVDAERRRTVMAECAAAVTESVAVAGDTIVGWLVAGPPRDEDRALPGQGEIYACYVLPGRWGCGVGGRLLSHALAALAAAGRHDISLWVLEDNHRARRFYESFGFRAEGGRKLLDLGEPVAEVRYLRGGQ